MHAGIQKERAWVAGNSRLARALYAVGILAAALLALLHAVDLAARLDARQALPALLGLVAGLAAADWVSGVVHWACDTWGDERTRWLGPGLIRSFREHHRSPGAMLDHDWIDVNGEAATAGAVAFALLALPPVQALLAGQAFLHAALFGLIVFGALANQLHQWAHAPAPPAAVAALQRAGLLLSRARHARHHRAPHTRGYCISTGWLNGVLDATGFWRGLERIVTMVTGSEPRTGAARREST